MKRFKQFIIHDHPLYSLIVGFWAVMATSVVLEVFMDTAHPGDYLVIGLSGLLLVLYPPFATSRFVEIVAMFLESNENDQDETSEK